MSNPAGCARGAMLLPPCARTRAACCRALAVMVLLVHSTQPTRADEWAFQWVEIAPPSGYSLEAVSEVNNLGHVACRVKKDDGDELSHAVYRDGRWRIDPPDDADRNGVESLGIGGANQKAVGLNQHNEVIAKKTLFYEDGEGDLQSVSLTNISGIPLGTAVGEYNTSTLAFTAINDQGWIAGKTGRYIDSQTQVQMVLLLVPFDRDNEGTPDYREIIADPELDTDEDWVLDTTTKMRVGMYAIDATGGTDQLVQDVANITAVRLHANYNIINLILDSQTPCTNWRDALSYLGGHDNENHQGKEIILMIRTPWPTDDSLDYIPDAQTQAAMLADLRCFVSKYCRDIDAIQFGNEIFGGPGEYYVDLGGECVDRLRLLPADCFAAGCEAVFEWMQKQADAVHEASALAGRPLQMITPAISWGQVNTGYSGNVGGDLSIAANRDAFATQCAVAFGNRNGAAVDIHLHYNDSGERSAVFTALDRLLEGNSGQQTDFWDPPFAITALVWSPFPPQTWVNGNQNTINAFLGSDPEAIETTWEQFIDVWAFDEFNLVMEDIIDADLAAFDGLLRHACYGEYQQGGGTLDRWDMTVVRASRVYSPDLPWMLETNLERLTNVAKGLAVSGAGYIPYTGFDPHPNEPFDGDCGCD